MQFQIKSCASDYTESGTTPDFTYSCSGSETNVYGGGSYQNFAQSGAACLSTCTLSNITTTAGTVTHLHFYFTLADASPNASQGSSFQSTLTFNLTQRTGTNA